MRRYTPEVNWWRLKRLQCVKYAVYSTIPRLAVFPIAGQECDWWSNKSEAIPFLYFFDSILHALQLSEIQSISATRGAAG